MSHPKKPISMGKKIKLLLSGGLASRAAQKHCHNLMQSTESQVPSQAPSQAPRAAL